MRTDMEIVQLLEARRSMLTKMQAAQRQIAEAYHDDLIVPVPEMDQLSRPTVANIINLGIDGTSQRISSLMPVAKFLPDSTTQIARERARMRRDWVRYLWDDEHVQLKMGRLSRHFNAYAQAIMTLIPGNDNRACWIVHDPLHSFPAECHPEQFVPENVIFERTYTAGWLRSSFPWLSITLPPRDVLTDSTECKVVEFLDADERVLLANYEYQGFGAKEKRTVRIAWAKIDLSCCPAVIAQRPGLTRPSGQMDSVIGAYLAQNMLQSLEIIATKKSVFPDLWWVGKNGPARIVVEADGLRGISGEVTDGTPWIDNRQPGFMGAQAVDRLERNTRVSGRVPAEYGGESQSNVRTGVRGSNILASTIDFAVQEAQNAFAPFLYHADCIAIEYDRRWYGSPKTICLRSGDVEKDTTYVASDLWADGKERHYVEYGYAGTDANGLPISLGQRLGIETMSKRTAMTLDPLITDPEHEHDQIIAERLESAVLQSIEQGAATGAIPPHDAARIMALVKGDGKELADAIEQVQKEAQARQAQQVPPTSPAAQPGIAQPGAGAEAAPSIPPPAQGSRNFDQLMSALNVPQPQGAPA